MECPWPRSVTFVINRYYDPMTGSFVSVDPDINETHQSYAYAGDDPVNSSDPLGLCNANSCGNQSTDQIAGAYADMSEEVALSYQLAFCEETVGAEVEEEYITAETTNSPSLLAEDATLSAKYVASVVPLALQLGNTAYDAVTTLQAFNMKTQAVQAAMDAQNAFVAGASTDSAVVAQEASELYEDIGAAGVAQLSSDLGFLSAVSSGDAVGPSLGLLWAYVLDFLG
jgi:hypothetical protein